MIETQVLLIDMPSIPDQIPHSGHIESMPAFVGTLVAMFNRMRFGTFLYVDQWQAMALSTSGSDSEKGHHVGTIKVPYRRNGSELLAGSDTSLPARGHVMIKRIKARSTRTEIVLNFLKKNFTRADRLSRTGNTCSVSDGLGTELHETSKQDRSC